MMFCYYRTYTSALKDFLPISECFLFGLELSDEAHDSTISEKKVNSISLN